MRPGRPKLKTKVKRAPPLRQKHHVIPEIYSRLNINRWTWCPPPRSKAAATAALPTAALQRQWHCVRRPRNAYLDFGSYLLWRERLN